MSETISEKLKKELCSSPKNGIALVEDEVIRQSEDYCEGYNRFLDNAKTEREAVSESVRMLEAEGFVPYVPVLF